MTTCEMISNLNTIADFLVWPTSCNYNFYLIIFLVFTVIIGWSIYVREKNEKGTGDLMGAFAISSLGITIVSVIGTLIKSTDGIPMIQGDILLIFLAITIPLNAIWYFSNK